MEWSEIIALASVIGTLVLGLLQVRKLKSEATHEESSATKDLAEAASMLIQPYQQETERLRKRVVELEDIIEKLEGLISTLRERILFLETEIKRIDE